MKIVLTGMRGSGKTTIATLLGKKLGWQVLDTDALIEKTVKMPLADYIHKNGWPKFRAAEKRIVKKIATKDKVVIATGGGTLMNPENAKLLKKNGFVVLLTAPITVLKKRIAKTTNRPSLTGASPTAELKKVWLERKKIYEKIADVKVKSTEKPHRITEKILKNYLKAKRGPKFLLKGKEY